MTALDAEVSFPHSNLPLTENLYYQEFPDILKPGQIVSRLLMTINHLMQHKERLENGEKCSTSLFPRVEKLHIPKSLCIPNKQQFILLLILFQYIVVCVYIECFIQVCIVIIDMAHSSNNLCVSQNTVNIIETHVVCSESDSKNQIHYGENQQDFSFWTHTNAPYSF